MLVDPARSWYLSDLARHLGVTRSSLQRELVALVRGGIRRRSQDGNRVYFQADADCPFLVELRGIFLKTVGLRDVLVKSLKPFRDMIGWLSCTARWLARKNDRPVTWTSW